MQELLDSSYPWMRRVSSSNREDRWPSDGSSSRGVCCKSRKRGAGCSGPTTLHAFIQIPFQKILMSNVLCQKGTVESVSECMEDVATSGRGILRNS